MPRFSIDSLDDPRLDPYRSIARTNLTRWSGEFIAEGKLVVQRLLQSSLECRSVLVSGDQEIDRADWIPKQMPTYVVPLGLARDLVGYQFHNGFLAVGVRPAALKIHDVPAIREDRRCWTVVVCPQITNPENLGAMIRLCAGFGIDALLLGRGSCDAYARRVLRISMGTAFRLPIVECANLADDLSVLHREHQCEWLATVLDRDAEPLADSRRAERMGLLFGNESSGLTDDWLALCNRRVTIPMATGVDSLNVAVAAGIFLHHYTQGRPPGMD